MPHASLRKRVPHLFTIKHAQKRRWAFEPKSSPLTLTMPSTSSVDQSSSPESKAAEFPGVPDDSYLDNENNLRSYNQPELLVSSDVVAQADASTESGSSLGHGSDDCIQLPRAPFDPLTDHRSSHAINMAERSDMDLTDPLPSTPSLYEPHNGNRNPPGPYHTDKENMSSRSAPSSPERSRSSKLGGRRSASSSMSRRNSDLDGAPLGSRRTASPQSDSHSQMDRSECLLGTVLYFN